MVCTCFNANFMSLVLEKLFRIENPVKRNADNSELEEGCLVDPGYLCKPVCTWKLFLGEDNGQWLLSLVKSLHFRQW